MVETIDQMGESGRSAVENWRRLALRAAQCAGS